jgi:hypothetical protein
VQLVEHTIICMRRAYSRSRQAHVCGGWGHAKNGSGGQGGLDRCLAAAPEAMLCMGAGARSKGTVQLAAGTEL